MAPVLMAHQPSSKLGRLKPLESKLVYSQSNQFMGFRGSEQVGDHIAASSMQLSNKLLNSG